MRAERLVDPLFPFGAERDCLLVLKDADDRPPDPKLQGLRHASAHLAQMAIGTFIVRLCITPETPWLQAAHHMLLPPRAHRQSIRDAGSIMVTQPMTEKSLPQHRTARRSVKSREA